MKLKTKYRYTVIEATGRTPGHKGEMELTIEEATATEAPVAIVGTYRVGQRVVKVEYRWYQGKLWTAMRLEHARPMPINEDVAELVYAQYPDELDFTHGDAYRTALAVGFCSYGCQSKEDTENYLRIQARDHLLVDGVPHRVADEPRYQLMSAGLGADTSHWLALTHMTDAREHPSTLFSILEQAEALAALKAAIERTGQPPLLPITLEHHFDVLIPDAIGVNRARRCPANAH